MLMLWILISLAAHPESTDNWPGFLDAGSHLEQAQVPLHWEPDKNIAWKAPLPGHGQSSPIVWDGQVYVTAIEGPNKETNHLIALDLRTGEVVWKRSIDSSDPVENTLYVSRAAPTPVADANGVYAFYESGDLVAFNHQGEKLWQRSLSKEYGKFQNEFGIGSSIAQTADNLILLADHEGPSYLMSINKKDGNNRWKTPRESRISWSSPALVEIGGQPQIVVSSSGSVDGYDPSTGDRLWTLDEVGGNNATTPIDFGGGRFLIGASPGERQQFAGLATKSNIAVQVVVADGKPQVRRLWTAERALASFASPIVYQGHAYWLNQVGAAYCFDVESGETRYAERTGQSCWATPVGIGDRIYFFGKDGQTTVLATGPKFEKLAENQLWDPEQVKLDANDPNAARFGGPIQYGVAVSGNSLLIRTGEMLFCVREETAE